MQSQKKKNKNEKHPKMRHLFWISLASVLSHWFQELWLMKSRQCWPYCIQFGIFVIELFCTLYWLCFFFLSATYFWTKLRSAMHFLADIHIYSSCLIRIFSLLNSTRPQRNGMEKCAYNSAALCNHRRLWVFVRLFSNWTLFSGTSMIWEKKLWSSWNACDLIKKIIPV